MLKLSKLSDYALIILQYLAQQKQRASVTDISKSLRLPPPTVSKLLKILNKSNLTESTRGSSGGYGLKLRPEAITIAQVIYAIDGATALTECAIAKGLCEYDSSCAMKENWLVINQVLTATLGQLSLADLSRPLHSHPALMGLLKAFEPTGERYA